MNDTPPRQMPTVREGTTFGLRFSVATWAAIVTAGGSCLVVFAGGCIWLYKLWAGQEASRDWQVKFEQRYEQDLEKRTQAERAMQAALDEMLFRQKYGVTASVPPSTPRPSTP
jgi:hypothetical protein